MYEEDMDIRPDGFFKKYGTRIFVTLVVTGVTIALLVALAVDMGL